MKVQLCVITDRRTTSLDIIQQERAEHRAAMGSGTGVEADVDHSTMAEFDNPVADGGDSDDEESAKGKKGSKGKD
jgi:hypothetical protein